MLLEHKGVVKAKFVSTLTHMIACSIAAANLKLQQLCDLDSSRRGPKVDLDLTSLLHTAWLLNTGNLQ